MLSYFRREPMADNTKWSVVRNGQGDGAVAVAGEAPKPPPFQPFAPPAMPPQPGPMPIGYFSPATDIPERALSNLRGHARPTGDTHDWPLDEQRLGQFQDTLRIRKKVTAAAGLYKLLLLVALIFFVIFAITGLTALMEQKTNQRSTGVTVIVITVVLGICVFYYFAERGTRRSQAWAPMTMFILFLVGGAFQVLSLGLVARATTAAQSAGAGVGLIVALIFNVAFAVVSLRAVMAMPKYLAQPAWCQELIAKAGL
jgi:hypothetical protein